MSQLDKKYRARLQAKRYILESLLSHDAKHPQVRLLQNGYVHPDHYGMESRSYQLEKQVSDEPLTFTEITSLSTWFDIHPEKIAGTEVITTSLFFPIKIEGDKQTVIDTIRSGNIRKRSDNKLNLKLKLKAKAIKTNLMLQNDTPTESLSGLSGNDFFAGIGALSPDTEKLLHVSNSAMKNVLALSKSSLQGLGMIDGLGAKKEKPSAPKKNSDIPVLSFEHIVENYNKGLSQEEIVAWVWYKRSIGEKMKGWEKYYISDKANLTEDGLKIEPSSRLYKMVQDGVLFYVSDEHNSKVKILVPYPIYAYGNMYDRILQLERDKSDIESIFGKKVYDQQKKVIDEAKPKPLSIMNPDHRERQKILAISKFAKQFYIKDLREDSGIEIKETENPEYWDEDKGYTLTWAFANWMSELQKSEPQTFKNVTAYQIWEYYIQGRNLGRSLSDSEKETIQKYSPQEGEELFARFLHEGLTVQDQQKLDMLWNRTFNGFSSVPYQRIPIGFECSSKFKQFDFAFTPIQREGIAFMKAVGSGIVAYDVGVGKTITAIITIANEMYSGKCTRPLIAVPNGTYKKWIREIFGYNDEDTGEYYAGVLSGTGITLNDWGNLGAKIAPKLPLNEAVPANSITMVTYEGFVKIGFGEKVMNDLFQELSEILAQVDGASDKSMRDKEKEYQGYRELIGVGQKGTIADIDVLGFDYIVIDEAHNFKNVFKYVPTDDAGVKRFKIDSTDSSRAKKAFFLCNYIQRTFGSNVMLLTATPFSNNPIEVFSMLSLVAYGNMKKMGISNLYAFMELFILQSLEYVNSYDGTIAQKHVVKSFNNRLILQKLIYNHISYKTGEEAGVKRPCKINLPRTTYTDNVTGQVRKLAPADQQTTYLLMNDAQLENQQEIVMLAQSGGTPAERAKAVMQSLARSLDNAFSPHVYSKETPESAVDFVEQSPKILYTMECIRSIRDYHISRNEPVSNQVIYSNRGKQYFKYIKEYLETEIGYKKGLTFNGSSVDEVEILTSDVSQEDREFIKEAYQANICKIVIGTATIREGIDLQKYCTGIFNLYPDWNPTDVKQLEGRGWRQGNTFGYVRVVMPLVQDSMDVFVFQKLEEKTARVNDIWYRADRGNVLDVEALDPEEVKFALYTDLKELAKIVLDKEEKELNRKKLVIESNIKMVAELSTSLSRMKTAREQCISSIQDWKVALQDFPSEVAKNISSWEDYGAAKLKEYDERSSEIVKEIQQWQSEAAQDDKFIISLYNRIKDSIFKTKSVVNVRYWEFEAFKLNFLQVSKAEKTVMQQRGYTFETDFNQAIQEMKFELENVENSMSEIRSAEHVDAIIEEIQIRKSENKVEGRIAEAAADDFIKLNHLLAFKFNETDIEGCKIPPRVTAPAGKPKVQAGLALRLKLKAKAIKIKLSLSVTSSSVGAASEHAGKTYLWKDKSGRGEPSFVAKHENIADDTETESWDGEQLAEWIEVAEIGDDFENAAEKYTRVS